MALSEKAKLYFPHVTRAGGYDIYRPEEQAPDGFIGAIAQGSLSAELGQLVRSNGYMGRTAGTLGIVTELCVPGTGGRTSDFINVWFEKDVMPMPMKFKYLDFTPVKVVELESAKA